MTLFGFSPRQLLAVPVTPPVSLLEPASRVAAFNEAWYRRAPGRRPGAAVDLDLLPSPGRRRQLERSCTGRADSPSTSSSCRSVPRTSCARVLEKLSSAACGFVPRGVEAFRRRPGRGISRSRARAGRWRSTCLSGQRGSRWLLDELDELVAAAGGRVYLSKDGRVRPEILRSMYPRIDEWAEVRRSVDPDGVLESDLSRRLAARRPSPPPKADPNEGRAVNDVTGMPQTVVVIGGGSDISRAILRSLAGRRLSSVLLAGQDNASLAGAAEELRALSVAKVETERARRDRRSPRSRLRRRGGRAGRATSTWS